MKRYFLARDEFMPSPGDLLGHYHFIELTSHGPAGEEWNLICLHDNHVKAPENWIAFPLIYDATTTLAASAVPHEALADIGLTGTETTLQAVLLLGEIHPMLGL